MIYTLTFNPALDYTVVLDGFKEGELNRTKSEYISFGGKGINVSVVLKNLGVQNTALGFLAGFTGKELERALKDKGIKTDFIYLNSGVTRINVKIKSDAETEINSNGPQIDKEAIDKLFCKLDGLKGNDILILSGSIPKNLNQNIYSEILKRLYQKQIKLVVDAAKDLLTGTLKYKPFLIKPNLSELEEIAEGTLKSEEEIISFAKRLKEMGAQNILVSLGEKGALLIDESDLVHKQTAPCGKLVNSVGAGDSMIAGFLKGYLETKDYCIALKYGVAAGSATAFSKDLADFQKISEIFNKIT